MAVKRFPLHSLFRSLLHQPQIPGGSTNDMVSSSNQWASTQNLSLSRHCSHQRLIRLNHAQRRRLLQSPRFHAASSMTAPTTNPAIANVTSSASTKSTDYNKDRRGTPLPSVINRNVTSKAPFSSVVWYNDYLMRWASGLQTPNGSAIMAPAARCTTAILYWESINIKVYKSIFINKY